MKNNNRFISIILVLSMLACLFTTSFAVEFTDSLDGENDIGSEIIHKDFIPKASDVEHVHGSVGWNCSQECSIPEHVHTIDACYVRSEELVCGYLYYFARQYLMNVQELEEFICSELNL